MKTRILLLAGMCLGLAACESMDLVPKSQGNTESWYTTETELRLASNEFYILGYWQEPLNSSEQWSDNTTYRQTNRNPGSGGTILDGTMNGQQYEVYALWQQSFKLIARANTMLENIHKAKDNVTQEVYDRYAGEAYFCRACKYADLIFFYGDVPYQEETITISEALQRGRRPKAEVIPLVYADFDKAVARLPESYGQDENIHATKGAALAMKARFALYMGDWELAAESAKACMNLQAYQLHPDFSDLFLMNTKNSIESILVFPRSVQYNILYDATATKNELPRNAGGYGSYAPSWDLLASFLCTDGLPIDESPLFDPHNPFKNRDPRCTATIVEFGTRHCSFDFDPHPDALKVMNYKTGKMVTNQDTRANAQYTSFNALLWKKGIDDSWVDNKQKVESDYIEIRYAEVLLTYAEAMIELNKIDESVLEAINSVRARAYGVKSSETDKYPAVTARDQKSLRQTVRLERRVEFAKEGLRYMDLIRWKLATKALNTKNYGILYPADILRDKVTSKGLWFWPTTPQIDEDGIADFSAMEKEGLIQVLSQRKWDERQYLWPIPTSEIIINENMKQNPGY